MQIYCLVDVAGMSHSKENRFFFAALLFLCHGFDHGAHIDNYPRKVGIRQPYVCQPLHFDEGLKSGHTFLAI